MNPKEMTDEQLITWMVQDELVNIRLRRIFKIKSFNLPVIYQSRREFREKVQNELVARDLIETVHQKVQERIVKHDSQGVL